MVLVTYTDEEVGKWMVLTPCIDEKVGFLNGAGSLYRWSGQFVDGADSLHRWSGQLCE